MWEFFHHCFLQIASVGWAGIDSDTIDRGIKDSIQIGWTQQPDIDMLLLPTKCKL
jgi:hypothetical protein